MGNKIKQERKQNKNYENFSSNWREWKRIFSSVERVPKNSYPIITYQERPPEFGTFFDLTLLTFHYFPWQTRRKYIIWIRMDTSFYIRTNGASPPSSIRNGTGCCGCGGCWVGYPAERAKKSRNIWCRTRISALCSWFSEIGFSELFTLWPDNKKMPWYFWTPRVGKIKIRCEIIYRLIWRGTFTECNSTKELQWEVKMMIAPVFMQLTSESLFWMFEIY